MRAIDISHYTRSTMGRDLTFDDIKSVYDQGVRRIMPSTAIPDIYQQQVGTIHGFNSTVADAIEIQPYRYISLAYVDYDINQAKEMVQWARDLGAVINKLWWDWEDFWNQASQDDKILACDKALEAGVGFCTTGFYSAYWYWTGYMANTDKYKDIPWWIANYDGAPNLSMGNYPFGGINVPQMKQFKENTYVGTIYCDDNYYEDSTSPPPVVTPPPVIAQGVYTSVDYDELGKARKIHLEIVG